MIDDLLERLELLALVVLAGKVDLMIGQLVASVRSDQAFGVNEVEAFTSLLLGKALSDEEVDDLLGHSNTGRSRSQEDCSMFSRG